MLRLCCRNSCLGETEITESISAFCNSTPELMEEVYENYMGYLYEEFEKISPRLEWIPETSELWYECDEEDDVPPKVDLEEVFSAANKRLEAEYC